MYKSFDGPASGYNTRYYHGQIQRLELPVGVEIVTDIAETLSAPGRAHKTAGYGAGAYNRVPGVATDACHNELLAYCLERDNLATVLEKVAAQIAKCPATKQVTLVTMEWSHRKWAPYQEVFQMMPANFTVVLFAFGRLSVITP